MQQLADAADAAVAQMVDIVRLADAVGHAVEIVDRRVNIVEHDVLRNQVFDMRLDRVAQRFALELLLQRAQHVETDAAVHAELGRVKVDKAGHVDKAVGEYADLFAVDVQPHVGHAEIVELAGALTADRVAGIVEDLAGQRVGHRAGECEAGNAREQ